MSGYTFATLEILRENICEESMKIRNMKDDVKNILCSTTNPIQKTKENVRIFKEKFVKIMYLMIILKVRPGTPLFCSGILTGMSFYIPNPMYRDFEEDMNHGIFFMFLNIREDSQKNWISKVSNKIKSPMKKARKNNGSVKHDHRILVYLIFIRFFCI